MHPQQYTQLISACLHLQKSPSCPSPVQLVCHWYTNAITLLAYSIQATSAWHTVTTMYSPCHGMGLCVLQ